MPAVRQKLHLSTCSNLRSRLCPDLIKSANAELRWRPNCREISINPTCHGFGRKAAYSYRHPSVPPQWTAWTQVGAHRRTEYRGETPRSCATTADALPPNRRCRRNRRRSRSFRKRPGTAPRAADRRSCTGLPRSSDPRQVVEKQAQLRFGTTKFHCSPRIEKRSGISSIEPAIEAPAQSSRKTALT